MKYTYVIWDFNGTLFDDVQIGIESINVLLAKRSLPRLVNREEYSSSFMFPIREWYKKLGFDFEKESYDTVAAEWVKEYLSRESSAGLVSGVLEPLEFFKKENVKQVVISASEISMLTRQLKDVGIYSYFEEIVGVDNVWAAGKTEIALEWKKRHLNDKLLFIGDTDHDHLVSEAIGADCILIAAGHQSFDRLMTVKSKLAVLHSPLEVIPFLNAD